MADAPPPSIRRTVATEAAPGFLVMADASRPDLTPLLVAAWQKSGAAFIAVPGGLAPSRPGLRRLDLAAILASTALWDEGPLVCGAAKVIFDRFRPMRAATHPPQLGPILAIRALALGGAVSVVEANAPSEPAAPAASSAELEPRHANHLLVLSAVRRDLARVPFGDPAGPACAALAAAVAEATLSELQLWSFHRGVLWNQDQRATWAPHQPDTSRPQR